MQETWVQPSPRHVAVALGQRLRAALGHAALDAVQLMLIFLPLFRVSASLKTIRAVSHQLRLFRNRALRGQGFRLWVTRSPSHWGHSAVYVAVSACHHLRKVSWPRDGWRPGASSRVPDSPHRRVVQPQVSFVVSLRHPDLARDFIDL